MQKPIIETILERPIDKQIQMYINAVTKQQEKDESIRLLAQNVQIALHIHWSEKTLNNIYFSAEEAFYGTLKNDDDHEKNKNISKKEDETSVKKTRSHRPEIGMMKIMGYEVSGSNTHPERCMILDTIYNAVLPPIHSDAYLSNWGGPLTEQRLKKMVNSIATFARNRVRTSGTQDTTFSKWDADLKYLKKYYTDDMNFTYPTTNIQEKEEKNV